MVKVLIIGGNGFIGRHLTKTFSIENTEIFVYDRNKQTGTTSSNQNHIIGDISDGALLKKCFNEIKPNIVYYLATNFNVNSFIKYLTAVNDSILNIHELINNIGKNSHFIYVGSSAQYGCVPLYLQPVVEETPSLPVSNYGMLKTIEEIEFTRLLNKKNIHFSIARIFNITGPNEPDRMVGGSFISQLHKTNKLKVGNLYPKRDFLDVRDVAKALHTIGLKGKNGETYNICSMESISIENYLKIIIEILGIEPNIEKDPKRLNKNELDDLVGDNSKLRNSLGWRKEINIKDSIKDLINSYKVI